MRQLAAHEDRIAHLRDEVVRRERVAGEVRAKLALLAQIAYDEEQDSAFPVANRRLHAVAAAPEQIPVRGYLRGSEIRIAAVRVLAATANPSRPIHYDTWFKLFSETGYGIAGQEPHAVFLTQISRSPLVARTAERGVYALDLDVPRRLREELHRLHHELAGLHEGQQTIDEIATVATRRADLTNRVVKVERQLEEAVNSLGFDPEERHDR